MHNPEYVYDNKLALQDEERTGSSAVAGSAEIKNPVNYYNLSDRDLKEGNGSAANGGDTVGDKVRFYWQSWNYIDNSEYTV